MIHRLLSTITKSLFRALLVPLALLGGLSSAQSLSLRPSVALHIATPPFLQSLHQGTFLQFGSSEDLLADYIQTYDGKWMATTAQIRQFLSSNRETEMIMLVDLKSQANVTLKKPTDSQNDLQITISRWEELKRPLSQVTFLQKYEVNTLDRFQTHLASILTSLGLAVEEGHSPVIQKILVSEVRVIKTEASVWVSSRVKSHSLDQRIQRSLQIFATELSQTKTCRDLIVD